MIKGEFLQGLQDALSGEVPPAVVQENLRYYDDYIRTQSRNGRSETEVLEELGSPRLIARTIIEATPGAGEGGYEPYRTSEPHRTENTYNQNQNSNIHYYNLNKWYWKVLGIILTAAIILLVVSVVAGLLSLVIPMLPVIGLVILIMYFIRGK
ncbi:MAG: DUF1700 domain-containing protein [Lachnospiraceae bacterium]